MNGIKKTEKLRGLKSEYSIDTEVQHRGSEWWLKVALAQDLGMCNVMQNETVCIAGKKI